MELQKTGKVLPIMPPPASPVEPAPPAAPEPGIEGSDKVELEIRYSQGEQESAAAKVASGSQVSKKPQIDPTDLSAIKKELSSKIEQIAKNVTALTGRSSSPLNESVDKIFSHLEAARKLSEGLSPDNSIASKWSILDCAHDLEVRLKELKGLDYARGADGLIDSTQDALLELESLASDSTYERSRQLLDGLGAFPAEKHIIVPEPSDIPNYDEVTPYLVRGGQPGRDGFEWLQNRGIKANINLRSETSDEIYLPRWANIKTYTIPVQDMEKPTFEQVEEFIRLVDDPENQPVFVHCRAGIGRTGTMIACYRISKGWSVEKALAEAHRYSYDGYIAQDDFIRAFWRYWKEKHPSPAV